MKISLKRVALKKNKSMSNDYDKLLSYSFRLLAKKRYTTLEISQKMSRFLHKSAINDEELIGEVLERLTELNYLDDRQYAKDYCSGRENSRPSGKALVRRGLKMKGIPSQIIDEVLDSPTFDEFELAKDAFSRKSNQWRNIPPQKLKEKAFRFLASRGFSSDTIYKVVNAQYDDPT